MAVLKRFAIFVIDTDLSLTLGLLVDTSLSQRNVLGQERSASTRFLDQVLREKKDKAFLIHFDREVELLQDFTSSRKLLETALGSLETPDPAQRGGTHSPGSYPGAHRRGGGTLLYDAVFLASNDMLKKQSGRKAIVILSDGVDTGSKVSLESAVESAQRADTLVYSVLFADAHAYGAGRGYGGSHSGGYGGMGRHGGGGQRYPQQSLPDGKKILEKAFQGNRRRFF